MAFPALGIDISKDKFHVCFLRTDGKQRRKSFPNTAAGLQLLTTWLGKNDAPQVHACLEATGSYAEPVAEHLHQSGHTVSLVNPLRIKAFAESLLRRTKTDKADAELIARFCQTQRPETWTPPAPEVRQLQGLVRRLEALMQMRQQEQNRLESAQHEVAGSVHLMIGHLDEEIARVKRLIQEQVEAHPELKSKAELLESIPGIGSLTAARLLAELPASLESAREAAAYAGLSPEEHQSGSSVQRRTRLSKRGNARLRKALYMPALAAMRYNPVVRSFCARLHDRGKAKMAVVGAAMRKLLHIAFGVLKNRIAFDPHYTPTAA